MYRKHWKETLAAGALCLGMAAGAQATLIDNGNGTVSDTSSGLMWTKNANLAASNTFGLSYDTDLGNHPDDSHGSSYTEVIRPTGRMNWGGALRWIDAMNAANYAGYDDWRLPIVIDNGNDGCNFGYSGTDCGYNVDTGTGELAYLFHDILGNTSRYDTDGDDPTDGSPPYDGSCSTTDPLCLQSTGADGVTFDFLQSYLYWSGTEYAPYSPKAWVFGNGVGRQGDRTKDYELYAWAVRSGEAAVPEPTTGLLLGLGLAGIGWVRRGRARPNFTL